ncbi:nonstructural protein precursor, partial [Triatoma virus]
EFLRKFLIPFLWCSVCSFQLGRISLSQRPWPNPEMNKILQKFIENRPSSPLSILVSELEVKFPVFLIRQYNFALDDDKDHWLMTSRQNTGTILDYGYNFGFYKVPFSEMMYCSCLNCEKTEYDSERVYYENIGEMFDIDPACINGLVIDRYERLRGYPWESDKISYTNSLLDLCLFSSLSERSLQQMFREPRISFEQFSELTLNLGILKPFCRFYSSYYFNYEPYMNRLKVLNPTMPKLCTNLAKCSKRISDRWSCVNSTILCQCREDTVTLHKDLIPLNLNFDLKEILAQSGDQEVPSTDVSINFQQRSDGTYVNFKNQYSGESFSQRIPSTVEAFCLQHSDLLSRISEMSPSEFKKLVDRYKSRNGEQIVPESQAAFSLVEFNLPSLQPLIDQLCSLISSSISDLFSMGKVLIQAIVICVSVLSAVLAYNYLPFKAVSGFCLLICSLYFAEDVLCYMREILDLYITPQAQSGGIESLWFCTNVFNALLFRNFKLKSLSEFARFIAIVPRAIQGIDCIGELISKAFEFARISFYKYVLKSDVPITQESPVTKWSGEVQKYYMKYLESQLVYDEINFNLLGSLYQEGIVMLNSHIFVTARPLISRLLAIISSILMEFKNRGFSESTIRNPPVTIYISGDTGVGKSTLSYPLSADIIKKIAGDTTHDLKNNWKKLIYTRNSEQEFWDGYTGQLCCVFDDFGQRIDTSSNPNLELFEIIRAANMYPYPLHMAELSQKQNTFFSSKVIMCSTNVRLEDIKTESLNFPIALKRRFDINVRVSLKPEIDKESLWKSERFDPSIYCFTEVDYNGSIVGALSYKELVNRICSLYSRRSAFVQSIDSFVTSRFEDLENEEVVAQVGYLPGDDSKSKVRYLSVAIPSLIESHVSDWNKRWNNLIEKYPFLPSMKVIGGVMGLLAVGLGISTMFWKKTEKKESHVVSFSESCEKVEQRPVVKCESCEKDTQRPTVRCETSTLDMKVDNQPCDEFLTKSQGVLDLNASEVLGKITKKNLYAMYMPGVRLGHALFIKGCVAAFPTHFIAAMKLRISKNPEAEVCFKSPFVNRPVWKMLAKDLINLSKPFSYKTNLPCDLTLAPIRVAWSHNDITDLFVSASEVSRVIESPAVLPLIMCDNGKDPGFGVIKFTSAGSRLQEKTDLIYKGPDSQNIYLRSAWEYSLDTQSGDCGAPLILRNPMCRGKICGIHVAGLPTGGLGYAVPITKEFILDCLSSFAKHDLTTICNVPEISQSGGVSQLPLNEPITWNDNLSIPGEFGLVGKARAIPSPSKSQITESLSHGVIAPVRTRTTLLSPIKTDSGPWNPMHERMRKYGRPLTALDEELVSTCGAALLNDLRSTLARRKIDYTNIRSCYDFQTAMSGIDGDETINSIKRKSSPGFPWVFKTSSGTGKKQIFGNDGEFLFDTPLAVELEEKVKEVIDLAKQGVRYSHVFVDALKDERKPREKAHKTRAFSGCPLEYLAVCKMYFQGIVSVLTKCKNETHISVGTNVYSKDWDFMARYLKSKSDGFVAGDFEGFDSSQLVPILREIGNVFNGIARQFPDWKPEDDEVRLVLLQSLWHSIHINGGDVVMWGHALPSGHYLTAPYNSLYATMLFSMAFVILSRRNGTRMGPSMLASKFFKEFGFVAYGDDHICAVPKRYQSFFNQMTLEKVFLELGIGYTTEDKREIDVPIRSLDEIAYLKRSFVLDEERQQWIAPLTLDTVLETPSWIHRCDDPIEATVSNIEFALRELSLHSKQEWEKYAPVMLSEVTRLGRTTIFHDWADTRAFVLDDLSPDEIWNPTDLTM